VQVSIEIAVSFLFSGPSCVVLITECRTFIQRLVNLSIHMRCSHTRIHT